MESPPRFPRTAGRPAPVVRARAAFTWRGLQAATVRVSTPRPAILLVRNAFDPGWHATVDGQPASLQPADYVAQGVPVPAGRHEVELTYDDPTIGYGVLGSALAMVLLLGAALVARVRQRTKRDPRR